jgi:hypothetical protein
MLEKYLPGFQTHLVLGPTTEPTGASAGYESQCQPSVTCLTEARLSL